MSSPIDNAETYESYSRIARDYQKVAELLILLTLISAVLIALISALIQTEPPIFNPTVGLPVFILLFLAGTGAQLALQITRYEQRWFQSRAVAETAKSLAWQYSTEAGGMESVDAEVQYLSLLKDAREEYSSSLGIMKGRYAPETEITPRMRQLRGAVWEVKKNEYVKNRIMDEYEWYDRKARGNKRLSRIYGSAAIATEIVGVTVAMYAFYVGTIQAAAPLALIATFVSSLVGWTQSRRYAELVEVYSYTRQILKEIQPDFEKVKTEPEFRQLVEVSERAISREHQMWKVRRGLGVEKHLRRT